MIFLVELDYVNLAATPSREAGQAFIEQIILPTLAEAEKLVAEKKIIAGGPVIGRIALRFLVQTDSVQEVDRIVSCLPLWPLSETRVTPLLGWADRREHVKAILDQLKQK
jgi:hypothetical protein